MNMNDNSECSVNSSLTRIQRVAKALYVIFMILFLLYCAGMLITLFMLIAGHFVTEPNIKSAFLNVDTVLSLVSGFIAAIALKLAASVFRDASNGVSPFLMKQVKRVQFIAGLLLVDAILTTILSASFISFVSAGTVEFGYTASTATSEAIPVDVGSLVWAVAFFCFSLIFEYGARLQQLTDDTV